MLKSLASFALLLVALATAAQACGPPAADPAGQMLTDAQATNVRRTAVADVQRIIANNPPATATPADTAIPRPACQDAIWWHEARAHVGESRKVEGPIRGTRPAPNGLAVVELGQPYPDPTGLAVLAPAAAAATLEGRTVCVTGRITNAEGRATILVRDAASIVVVE